MLACPSGPVMRRLLPLLIGSLALATALAGCSTERQDEPAQASLLPARFTYAADGLEAEFHLQHRWVWGPDGRPTIGYLMWANTTGEATLPIERPPGVMAADECGRPSWARQD